MLTVVSLACDIETVRGHAKRLEPKLEQARYVASEAAYEPNPLVAPPLPKSCAMSREEEFYHILAISPEEQEQVEEEPRFRYLKNPHRVNDICISSSSETQHDECIPSGRRRVR